MQCPVMSPQTIRYRLCALYKEDFEQILGLFDGKFFVPFGFDNIDADYLSGHYV